MVKAILNKLTANQFSRVEQVVFFALLLFLTFLGDGKQTIVDVIAAGGIISLFVIRKMHGSIPTVLPKNVVGAWAWTLACLIGMAFFSDSVGYSVSMVVRWVMAYLVFEFFSSTRQKTAAFYPGALLWFVGLGIVASWLFTFFPILSQATLKMNLLYPTYGHNHIAALIVFVFPFVLYRFTQNRTWPTASFFALIVVTLIFSFARGAIVVIGLYVLLYVLWLSEMPPRKKGAFSLLILCFVLGILVAWRVPRLFAERIEKNDVLKRQLLKQSMLENRISYWRQAVSGFLEQPLFGTGPGTFYLTSKRHQLEPARYSWYAHSFPLEMLSEIGVVGLVLVIFLCANIGREIVKKNNKGIFLGVNRTPLFHAVGLTLFYSLYEINLNFMVVWLLVWASAGILVSPSGSAYKRNDGWMRPSLMLAGVSLLCVYYFFSFVSSAWYTVTKSYAQILMLEPYNADVVSSYLKRSDNDNKLISSQRKLILFFHKKNPEVLHLLAKASSGAPDQERELYFHESVSGDPTNAEYWRHYIRFAATVSDTVLARVLTLYIVQYGSSIHRFPVAAPSQEEVYFLISFLGDRVVVDDDDRGNNLVRMFYGLGMANITKNPSKTNMWWTYARDSNPQWSYIHLELASLEKHVFGNDQKSKDHLTHCAQFVFASRHCRDVADTGIPAPGFFEDQVLSISR